MLHRSDVSFRSLGTGDGLECRFTSPITFVPVANIHLNGGYVAFVIRVDGLESSSVHEWL
jgi:hypothetical protein